MTKERDAADRSVLKQEVAIMKGLGIGDCFHMALVLGCQSNRNFFFFFISLSKCVSKSTFDLETAA